jgi:hypothetical protein
MIPGGCCDRRQAEDAATCDKVILIALRILAGTGEIGATADVTVRESEHARDRSTTWWV